MRGALAFLTIVGGARAAGRRSTEWFPFVGVLVGAAVGAVWFGAERWWQWPVAAAIAVAADLVLTGAIHFDGLADSADGLLPHLERSRRLEVMAAPEVGAFAVVVVGTVVLLRWSALASQPAAWTSIAALWGVSRGLMAVAVRALPYARQGGLADTFGPPSIVLLVPSVVGVVALMLVQQSLLRTVAVLAVAAIVGVGSLAFADRRLGGYTGDVLGAAGVIAETAGLLALAVGR